MSFALPLPLFFSFLSLGRICISRWHEFWALVVLFASLKKGLLIFKLSCKQFLPNIKALNYLHVFAPKRNLKYFHRMQRGHSIYRHQDCNRHRNRTPMPITHAFDLSSSIKFRWKSTNRGWAYAPWCPLKKQNEVWRTQIDSKCQRLKSNSEPRWHTHTHTFRQIVTIKFNPPSSERTRRKKTAETGNKPDERGRLL